MVGSSNKHDVTSVERLTPSELREWLFQEQEARITELVKHNAELTRAMEHERDQARLHAEANVLALKLIESSTRPLQPKNRATAWLSGMASNWTGNMLTPAAFLLLAYLTPKMMKTYNHSQWHHITPFSIFLELGSLSFCCAAIMNYFTQRVFINPKKPFIPKWKHVLWEQVFWLVWYVCIFIAIGIAVFQHFPPHGGLQWLLLISLPFILGNVITRSKWARRILNDPEIKASLRT